MPRRKNEPPDCKQKRKSMKMSTDLFWNWGWHVVFDKCWFRGAGDPTVSGDADRYEQMALVVLDIISLFQVGAVHKRKWVSSLLIWERIREDASNQKLGTDRQWVDDLPEGKINDPSFGKHFLLHSSKQLSGLTTLKGYMGWLGALQRPSILMRASNLELERDKDTIRCGTLGKKVLTHHQ